MEKLLWARAHLWCVWKSWTLCPLVKREKRWSRLSKLRRLHLRWYAGVFVPMARHGGPSTETQTDFECFSRCSCLARQWSHILNNMMWYFWFSEQVWNLPFVKAVPFAIQLTWHYKQEKADKMRFNDPLCAFDLTLSPTFKFNMDWYTKKKSI